MTAGISQSVEVKQLQETGRTLSPGDDRALAESALTSIKRNFEKVDVVVIGGGAAGLACLRHLNSAALPCSSVLLESRGVLCGRVKSVLGDNRCSVPLEGGAEFGYPDLLDALAELGVVPNTDDLTPVVPNEPNAHCIFDGKTLVKASDLFGESDPDVIRNRLFLEMREFGRDISIQEFLDKQSAVYRELETNAPEIALVVKNSLLAEYACDSLERMGIVACAEQAIDDQGDHHHNTLSGHVFKINSGYSSLIEKLAHDLDVRKRTTVTSIEHLQPGGFLVTARDANENSFNYYESQQVVLAVPVPTLSKIQLPSDVDYERAIRHASKGTYATGNVVKVVFKSARALLPEGMSTLSCLQSPVEVWQHKVGDSNFHYTLWIPGPAAKEFEIKAGLRDEKGDRIGNAQRLGAVVQRDEGLSSGSQAHRLVRSMLSDMFGEELVQSVSRMAILPWSLLKSSGHAYRTAAPTGRRFDQLGHAPFVKLSPGLYLAGADVNLATVPSALTSGMAAAEAILKARSRLNS